MNTEAISQFEKRTNRKIEFAHRVQIESLPDFDIDVRSSYEPEFGTRLTLDTGKIHNVAFSTIPLPWSLTKYSCDHTGIPHVDILPNSALDEFNELRTVDELGELNVLNALYQEHTKPLYHIHRWMKQLFQYKPIRTIEDLARFVGIIRPGVRELFLEQNSQLTFSHDALNLALNDKQIIFQEDILNCLKVVYDYDYEQAEQRRKLQPVLFLPVDDEDDLFYSQDRQLFRMVYDRVNPHVMSKGHCLQVAYIIMMQLYSRYVSYQHTC